VSGIVEVVAEVEAAGAALRLEGNKVRVRYRGAQQRNRLAQQISFLRAHRGEVADLLRARATVPSMPPGVRLLAWNPKQPPVFIEACSIVVETNLFARTTLAQLGAAIANPERRVGWTVPQLVDRLAQVGVAVALEAPPE